MAKSKHPPLMKTALADIDRINTAIKKDLSALKDIAKTCAATQKMATGTEGDFQKQFKYLQDVVEKYAKKCIAIEQLESDLAAAKGDKRKEADVKKALARADKDADAIRNLYNQGGKVFSTLSDLMRAQIDGLGASCGKFTGFYP